MTGSRLRAPAPPRVLIARMLLRPILGECAAPRELSVLAEFRYSTAAPFIVQICCEGYCWDRDVWEVSREVLAAGRRQRAGAMTFVEVYPSDAQPPPDGWGAAPVGRGNVMIALFSEADGPRIARFQVSGRSLSRFLHRTYALFPDGGEIPDPVLDREAERLLAGGGTR